MFQKVFVNPAFLLLCNVVKQQGQLNCTDITPAACKEQFTEEFARILQAGLIKKIEPTNKFHIEMFKEVTTFSKEESENATFLLLCHVVKQQGQLNCTDTTPAACKEQFKEEFARILQAGLIKKFVTTKKFYIEMFKEVTTFSKEESENTTRFFEDLIEQAKNSKTPKEIDQLGKMSLHLAYPEYRKKTHTHFVSDMSSEPKYFNIKRAALREFAVDVAGPTLELIDKLRPQDIAEFDNLPYYKRQFEEAKKDPDHCNTEFWVELATFLEIPLNQ